MFKHDWDASNTDEINGLNLLSSIVYAACSRLVALPQSGPLVLMRKAGQRGLVIKRAIISSLTRVWSYFLLALLTATSR